MKIKTLLPVIAFTASLLATAHAAGDPFGIGSGPYITGSAAYARATGTNNITISGTALMNGNYQGTGGANFFGGEISSGYYFQESDAGVHQIEFTTGLSGSSQSVDIIGSLATAKTTFDHLAVPLIFAYNYNLKVNDNALVYLGPRAGAMVLSQSVTVDNNPTLNKSSDVDTTYVVGVGLGFRYMFTKNAGIDVGYDFRRLGSPEFTHDFGHGVGATSQINDLSMHVVHVGFQWKF